MTSNTLAGTAPTPSASSGFDRDAALTRSLLGYGILAGPFYLAVALIQAFVRDGFDLTRHALSILANGRGGWVQTANFVLSGLMVIAAAVGFRRVVGAKSRGLTLFLSAFGASMLVAAVFRADPMDGFPVGTPLGMPTSITTHGLIHFIAGALGFTSLAVSCFFGAAVMRRRGVLSLALVSLLAGLGVAGGFFGGMAFSRGGIAGIWFAVVVGWAWLAAISLHLYRASPNPDCEPRGN
jgi:hypothetical membrane protein